MSRPATRQDFLTAYGRLPPRTVWARALESKDGKLLGLAGYWKAGGKRVVFSEVLGDIPKTRIWREAVAFMRQIPGPAVCVTESEGAARFLERLGWEHTGADQGKEVYEWRQ